MTLAVDLGRKATKRTKTNKQDILLKMHKMKNTTQQTLKRKQTGPICLDLDSLFGLMGYIWFFFLHIFKDIIHASWIR